MRYLFYVILCLCLAGCIPVVQPLVTTTSIDAPARGAVNHSGTQLSGVQNHGTMTVYIGSQVPGTEVQARVPNVAEKTIKRHEGLSLKPYKDTGDKLHIGYGRNLTGKGISMDEAEILFENDMAEALADLSENIFREEWPDLPGQIKSVLINMRFQLGFSGFRGFSGMIASVRANNWQTMAEEMKNSLWAEKTPNRSGFLIKVVEAIGREGD